MTTPLNLDPINTALCLAGFAIVWAFLFLRLYGEQRRRTAVWRAFWLHRYWRGTVRALQPDVGPRKRLPGLRSKFADLEAATAARRSRRRPARAANRASSRLERDGNIRDGDAIWLEALAQSIDVRQLAGVESSLDRIGELSMTFS